MPVGPDLPEPQTAAHAPLLSGVAGLFARRGSGPLALAVSGGGDSVALLRIAQEIAKDAAPRSLTVATVDHSLRPEARAEADWVAAVCARLGLPHRILTWEGDKTGGNLQDLARQARYRLLADWARNAGAQTVALGHTLDDQAETFFLQLSRSAGLAGLSGMSHAFVQDGVTFARPLLSLRRATLRDYLKTVGQDWIEDPSNQDDRFHRIRLRKAMPLLAELGVTAEAVTRSMAHLGSAEVALQDCTLDAARTHVTEDRGDLLIDTAGLSPEIAHRLWQQAFRWIGGSAYPPRASAMRDVLQRAVAQGSATLDGCLLTGQAGRLRLTREAAAVTTRTPTTEIWDHRWQIDGPHDPGLEIAALGAAIGDCPNWRDSDLPRTTLLASPAVWRGDRLVAAPLAGLNKGWRAQIVADFPTFLQSH